MATQKTTSKKVKLTTAQQRKLAYYNDIITRNKAQFAAGQSMTRQDFVNMFGLVNIVNQGTAKQITESNLALVNAYTTINMLMRENGLVIKSRDYYSFFDVLTKPSTKNELERMSDKIDRVTAKTERFVDKMEQRVQAKTWRTYNRVPTQDILTLGKYNNTRRHGKVLKRVQVL